MTINAARAMIEELEMDMEQSAAVSVPCVFTTQDPGSQVVVTQVQLPQKQVQPTAATVAASFQPSTSSEQQRPVTPLDARIQDGVSTIPAVQQALYQTEAPDAVSGQSLSAQGQFQGQLPTSYFSTTSIEGLVESSSSAVSVSPTSYDDVTQKLNQLFTTELTRIHSITEDHWKVQEFPLARIKKIMRMDEDVRMISAEVPVMLSKALELFITELSLRAWLQTEESKRRTVQRSDIAMAITKNDMFDFLIDIVPREEIQLRSKAQKNTEGGESLQLLPPELLQLCIQQLAQQALSMSTEGGLGEEGSNMTGGDSNDSNATVGQLQQQLQLLQQLIQIQQLQQEQQQLDQSSPGLGQTMQLQHPPILDQTPPTDTSTQSSSSIATGGTPTLDTEVLYSGMTTPGATGGVTGAGASGVTAGIQFTTVLEQLTGSGAGGSHNILSIQPEQHSNIITTVSSVGVNFTNGGQQTLRHVDPGSITFHHQSTPSQPQPHELLQQPGGSIAHSNTVIIQQPLMDDIITTTTTNQQSGTTVTTLLESQGSQFHHHQLQHVHLDQSQQQQLVSSDGQTASLQHQMVHHVLVDPSTVDHAGTGGHYQLASGPDGGVASPVIQSDPSQYSGANTSAATLEGGGAVGGVVFSLHDGLPTTSTYSS